MNNILILRLSVNDYFFPKLCDKYNIRNIYKKLNFIQSWMLKKRGGLGPFSSLVFDDWKENLEHIETIIIFDVGYNKYISKYIKNKNPNIKIILYLFNSILYDYQNDYLKDENVDEIWSFDKQDVKKYGLKYNSTFYYNPEKTSVDLKYDVVFLGRNKDRNYDIKEIQNELVKNGLKAWIKIINNEKDYMRYDTYLSYVNSSKCILDITQNGQAGLSLRFMESLFFEKKIITNNKYILDYDFYDKNNIYILGRDRRNLLDFINTPYNQIDIKIKSNYLFEKWIKRFL